MEQSVHPSATAIGWIGTGVMGAAMCGHLLDAGYKVMVSSRTRAKAEPLLDRGAVWMNAPQTVAESSQVIVTMVGFPADVRAVYFGPHGVLTAARTGAILIDMTT